MNNINREYYAQIWQNLLESSDIKKHINIHQKERKLFIDCVLKHIKGLSGTIKILEVGCGTAIDSYNLANTIDIDVYAIDYSWESITLSKETGNYFRRGIKLLVNDASNISFKDKTFDLVFSQGLIEHFKDPIPIIQEQLRVFKDEGLLIINVPQKFNPHTIYKHLQISKGLWPWGWETEYSYFGLKGLSKKFGLRLMDKCGYGYGSDFSLWYIRYLPQELKKHLCISKTHFFDKIQKLYDKLWLPFEKGYGYLFMQSIAVVFKKRGIVKSNNMNVCMISGSFYPMHCGIADYTFLFARALSKKDINVSVITKSIKNQPIRYSIDKVSVYRIIRQWAMFEILKLISHLKQSKPTIVHIQYAAIIYNNHIMINFLPFLIKMFIPKSKVVITYHEIIGPGILWRLWFSIFLKFANSIIVPNKIYQDALLGFNPSLIKKISIIPVGSNIPEDKVYKPTDKERYLIRQSFGIDEQTAFIASFGFIFPDKNLEILIKAAKLLIDAGSKIKLIFIGGESDVAWEINKSYRDKLDKYIKNLQMEKFVIYTGFVDIDRISKVLLSCDIAVMLYKDGVSSRRCSFISLLSCGLPIITTKGSSPMEGLVNYKNVLLLKNDYEEQLKQYILELINSKELRNRLSSEALELSKRYSWDIISKNTIDIYNSLINQDAKNA